MAKLDIQAGATSVSVAVFIQNSTSTTGAGLTGLVFNTSGLTCYGVVPGASAAAVTLATLAAANSAWATGGFKEIDATNMPGWYRFDIPNANIASGRSVGFHFQGAASMASLPLEISLTGWNNQDAVRGGMTALPNAAAEAAGGLYTRGSGAGQINQPANGLVDVNTLRWNGTAVSAPATAGIPDVNVKNMNNVAATPITTIKAVQGLTTADTIATYTGNTVQTGDSFARIGAAGAGLTALGDTRVANLDATVSSRTKPADTQAAVTTTTNLTNAPTAGDFTATMKTSIGTAVAASAVASVTGAVGSVTAAVAVTSNVKKNQALAKFQFLMTDSTTHAPKTGLTVSVTRSIDGAAYAAGTLANVAEVGNGMYTVDFGAGDVNGNVIVLQATAALADTTFERLVTQP